MSEIEFSFEELALIVEDGFEAGLINGTATIRYQTDGKWAVREIALDGFRRRTEAARAEIATVQKKPVALIRMFDQKPVALCRDSYPWLFGIIVDRLESEPWRARIAEAVADERIRGRDEYRAQLGKDRARGLEF